MILTSNIIKNDTICGCDGSIVIQAANGTPPYSYSINNGLSFTSIPFFTNLCPGLYTTLVTDSSGFTSSSSIILQENNNFVTYNIFLNTSNSIISDNGITVVKKYETTINVFPQLPSGVTITFTITHNNTSKSSPLSGSSTSLIIDTLEKNNVTQSLSFSSTTTGVTLNPNPGCQNQTVYIDTLTQSWNGITYSVGDTIVLTTYSTVTKNQNIGCYLGTSDEVYSLSNTSILGCNCCNVIVT